MKTAPLQTNLIWYTEPVIQADRRSFTSGRLRYEQIYDPSTFNTGTILIATWVPSGHNNTDTLIKLSVFKIRLNRPMSRATYIWALSCSFNTCQGILPRLAGVKLYWDRETLNLHVPLTCPLGSRRYTDRVVPVSELHLFEELPRTLSVCLSITARTGRGNLWKRELYRAQALAIRSSPVALAVFGL